MFQEGGESLEYDPSPGCPVSAQSKENVEKTCATVMRDRWITTRLLAECLGVGKKAARKIMERDLERRKIGLRFVPHYGWTERVAGGMLSQFQWFCWPRLWCVANSCYWWWKLVFSVWSWNEATKHGMTWNKLSSAEGSQVATIACQDNVAFFLLFCQNYPSQFCSWRHQSIQSLLFRSDVKFLHARALCQKQAVKKQPWAAVAWQHACTLCGECEAVSCFRINLCDPSSPLLDTFGTDNLFSLPEGETGLKRRAFQWQ